MMRDLSPILYKDNVYYVYRFQQNPEDPTKSLAKRLSSALKTKLTLLNPKTFRTTTVYHGGYEESTLEMGNNTLERVVGDLQSETKEVTLSQDLQFLYNPGLPLIVEKIKQHPHVPRHLLDRVHMMDDCISVSQLLEIYPEDSELQAAAYRLHTILLRKLKDEQEVNE